MAIFTKLHKRSGVTWWYVRVVGPDGRRIKERAGTTELQARKRQRILLGEVASGDYLDSRELKATPGAIMFAAFADRFLAEYPGRNGRPRSNHYSDRLRPAEGNRKAGILRRHFGAMALAA